MGPIVAARTPARVSRNPIDYSNRSGSALYDRATKNLFASADERYDLNSDGLMDFTDAVARRGKECGWDLFTVPTTNPAGAVVDKSLITEYGEITLQEVHNWIEPIVTAAALTRQAQEDAQLYLCLMNSLSKGAIGELMLKEDDFTLGGEGCGVKLFRIIMSESQVDTVATTNLLLGQLTSGLPDLMEKHGNNIKAFSNEVKTIIRRVKRRGTDPGSILPQLLTVLLKVQDKEGSFFRYIENLNNNYTDGNTTLTDMTLLDKALTKYEQLIESKEFESKDNKDETILSLEAKVEVLAGVVSDLKGKKASEKEATGGPSRTQREVPTWMTKAPKSGQPATKTVDGKTYHWCEGGGPKGKGHSPRWVIHNPSDCKARKNSEEDKSESEEEEKTPPKSESDTREKKKKVGWSTSLLTLVSEDSDSD